VAIAELRGSGISVQRSGGPGRFDSGCGAIQVASAPARVTGTVATLESGGPLRFRGCGPVTLPAGESDVSSEPGEVFRADQIRLASAAPEPLANASAPRVVDAGEGWNGSRDGVRLALNGSPAWLVLAESWSKGWHAYCTARGGNERDLGPPEPIDAFASGWRAPAGCATARFAFAPQRTANVAYLLSLAALAAMLVLLLVGELPSRRGSYPPKRTGSDPPKRLRSSDPLLGLTPSTPADPLIRLPWRWALTAGLAIGLAGGFVFALRAGAVLAPLTVLALRAGVSVRRLLIVAATGIGALPLVYIVFPARNRGGNEFGYPDDLLGAHWIAVLVVLCLLGAGLLLAARLRRASASGSRSST
jgi:hypothetical protein